MYLKRIQYILQVQGISIQSLMTENLLLVVEVFNLIMITPTNIKLQNKAISELYS